MATQTEDRAHVNAWLDPELHRRLVELARLEDRSVSSVIRRALREHVERDNREEDER